MARREHRVAVLIADLEVDVKTASLLLILLVAAPRVGPQQALPSGGNSNMRVVLLGTQGGPTFDAQRLGISEEEVRQRYVEQVPMKRGCTYQDVTNVVVFLASDQSSYMTGQAINVTGGQEMR